MSLGTRNYEQLVALMPGVASSPTDELYIGNSSPAGTAATLPYSVNGKRNSANNWTVDGADNVDRGSNLTLMTFPSVDAIAAVQGGAQPLHGRLPAAPAARRSTS